MLSNVPGLRVGVAPGVGVGVDVGVCEGVGVVVGVGVGAGRDALHPPEAVPPVKVADQLPLAAAVLSADTEKVPLKVYEAPSPEPVPVKEAEPVEETVPEPLPGDVTVITPSDTVNATEPLTGAEVPLKWAVPL